MKARLADYRKYAVGNKESAQNVDTSDDDVVTVKRAKVGKSDKLNISRAIQQHTQPAVRAVVFAKAPLTVVMPQQKMKYALSYLRFRWKEGIRNGIDVEGLQTGSGVKLDPDVLRKLSTCGRATQMTPGIFIYAPLVALRDKDHMIEYLRDK